MKKHQTQNIHLENFSPRLTTPREDLCRSDDPESVQKFGVM